jgi:CubicO group peptidase (beta-lactamase class C family)
MKSKIVLSLFLFVACKITLAQTTLPDAVRSNIQARIDNGSNTAIVVGIIDVKGTTYYSFGVKSLKTKEAVNENTVFEIGSISKTFTGILLADRVIKGEAKLDDPLQNYLPTGVTAPTRNGESIKLVHLSNHTSALPRLPGNLNPANPANPYADYSEKQLYDFLSSYALTRDIGSKYEYSNYAAGLLGHALATKKGSSFEQQVIDVIANPLDLNDTRITLTPAMKKNLAAGYTSGIEVANWGFNALAGAGAIRSTVADMAKFVSANMGIIKSKLYPALQLSHKNTITDGSAPKVGLGWHIEGAGESEIVWHNGGTGGYRSFIGFTKNGKIGVVVLTNSTEFVDDIGMHLLNPASPLTAIKPNVPEFAVDVNTLESYVGDYQLAPGFILTVSRSDNRLQVKATGQQELPVFAKSKNEFYYKVVEAQLTFTKNEDGKVESVTLHQGGRNMVGKKVEK